jgi:hypothetical protein
LGKSGEDQANSTGNVGRQNKVRLLIVLTFL